MKRILTTLLVLVPLIATAQEGSIVYDRAIKYDFEIPEAWKEYRDKIPSQSTTTMVLLFSESASLMKEVPVEEEEAPVTDGIGSRAQGMAMRLKMGSTSRSDQETILETYMDQDEGLFAETRDFMSRTFRITGEQPAYAWKLSGEQSEFLGYMVQKATAVQDSSTIDAWFTPEIPVSAGPGLFGGLPGMILVVSVDDERIVYSAKEVDLDGLGDEVIKTPEDGKKVSEEEYEQIVEEKLAELAALKKNRGSDRRR